MLAFIHIEKAAGMTIAQILKQSFGWQYCSVTGWKRGWSVHSDHFCAADLRRVRRLYRRLQSISGHGVKPTEDLIEACPGIRFFTLLREPLDRCASHYQYQVQQMGKRLPFREWIRDRRYANFQVRKLAGEENAERAIEVLRERIAFVGIMERFDESLVMLKNRFSDLPLNIRYRPQNVASDASLKKELLADPETHAILEEANREDLQLYRYVAETLYPRQVLEYGPTLTDDVEAFRAANRGVSPFPKRLLCQLKEHLVHRPAIRMYRWCCR